MFGEVYYGKRVLLTGHSGFKGSWLAFWLLKLGAKLRGMALAPDTDPSHFELLKLDMDSFWIDLRDRDSVQRCVEEFRPEIVFHLAAQPLVRASYLDPADTFATNVVGTANLLDALRRVEELRSVVVVTSDKCYENTHRAEGYKETDPMGGFDPYSASKGCQELVAASFRRSFFHPDDYGRKHQVLLASARAGNVVGGGDWARDRLVPDLMRAAGEGRGSELRNPAAVRPWQHVLEPLSGYLELGRRLWGGETACASGWNFGPADEASIEVGAAAGLLKKYWPAVDFTVKRDPDAPHEAALLRLDCSRARRELGWQAVWDCEATFRRTAEWYREFYAGRGAGNSSLDLSDYCRDASAKGLQWTR